MQDLEQGIGKELRAISLTVEGWPPAKDGASSIFKRKHSHYHRVIELRRSIRQALDESLWDRNEKRAIGLELTIIAEKRYDIPGDATNYLGGVADVLQADVDQSELGNLAQESLYTNDRQIQEIRYSVDQGGSCGYRVKIWLL